jgi:hypothetical protein
MVYVFFNIIKMVVDSFGESLFCSVLLRIHIHVRNYNNIPSLRRSEGLLMERGLRGGLKKQTFPNSPPRRIGKEIFKSLFPPLLSFLPAAGRYHRRGVG